MKLAYLFAGQGSQHAGLGEDLYNEFPAFKEAFTAGDPGFDLTEVCFRDESGLINSTVYTQPALVAFACGVKAVLDEMDIHPEYVAGLSLGEYSALHAAGVFDAKTAIELVAFRGRAMAAASEGLDCGMQAVMGLAEEPLAECCAKASEKGIVSICNYNCPGQLVIGGENAAVSFAADLAKEAGAKRCIPLNVSGPFHTSLMEPAGEALAERFAGMSFSDMSVPVLFNCLGHEKSDSDSIADLLVRQVSSGVYMEKTIRRLAELGVDTIIEIGPGKTLSGFVKKTVGDAIRCIPVETVEDIRGLKESL